MVFLHDPRIPRSNDILVDRVDEILVDRVNEGGSASTNNRENPHSKRKGKEIMENPQSLIKKTENLPSSKAENIILNHDFSEKNLKDHWKVTSTGGGRAVPHMSKYLEDILPNSGVNYLVITRRTSKYEGLEQDITKRFLKNVTYKFSAWVRLYGGSLGDEEEGEVLAGLKLDYGNKIDNGEEKPDVEWPTLASDYVSKGDGWKNLVGSYTFKWPKSEKSPIRVIFFFEGPAGVDLLINSVVMSPSI